MRLSQTEATLWHISQTLLLSSSAVDINEEEIVNVNTERRFIMPRTVLPGTGLSCWFQCMACVRLCTRECGVMHTSRAKRGSAVRPAIFPVHCMPSLDQDDYSRGWRVLGFWKNDGWGEKEWKKTRWTTKAWNDFFGESISQGDRDGRAALFVQENHVGHYRANCYSEWETRREKEEKPHKKSCTEKKERKNN